MVYAVDRGVGDIVAALNEKEILKDTLIVFQSDNGGKEGEDENQADNGRLKGGKGDVYDGGVRNSDVHSLPQTDCRWQRLQTPGLSIRLVSNLLA